MAPAGVATTASLVVATVGDTAVVGTAKNTVPSGGDGGVWRTAKSTAAAGTRKSTAQSGRSTTVTCWRVTAAPRDVYAWRSRWVCVVGVCGWLLWGEGVV